MRYPLGKIPPEILEMTAYKYLGSKRDDVILGPSRGEDAAIVRAHDQLLALKCDPISGGVERVGWLAINIASNDIATRGVKPNWALPCIMLPQGSGKEVLEAICKQIGKAARSLGISIVGGHSEITPGLDHPLVIAFSAGVVQGGRYVTSSGAKPGNKIILTKGAGIEGTAILASDRRDILIDKFGKAFVERAEKYYDCISIVQEALIAFELGGVSAMHDPTEGGLAGGLHELCDASKVGFKIYEKNIIIGKETFEICRFFKINPLNLIGSGALIIVVKPRKARRIVKQLQSVGISSSIIGEIVNDEKVRVIVKRDRSEESLLRPLSDELWVALERKF